MTISQNRVTLVEMDRLIDRVLLLVEEEKRRGGSQRKLSLRAGLSGGYVATLLTRLRSNQDADLDSMTARKIAAAAGVSTHWLITGEGARAVPTVRVHPHLAEAIRAAEIVQIERGAIDAVLADAASIEHDMDAAEWLRRIQAHARPLSPEPPSASDLHEITRPSLSWRRDDEAPSRPSARVALHGKT